MMHHEFEQLAGYLVTEDDYYKVIEPMYMATSLSKADFIETLNRKRFEYIPAKSPETIALEARLNEELAQLQEAIKDTKAMYERYKAFHAEDNWDGWRSNLNSCQQQLKDFRARVREIKFILSV